jgi:hypothetical protein
MKKLLLSLTALALTTGLFAQEATTNAAPKKSADDVAKFKSETLELGKITQNNPTAGIFEVTNISKEPLLIEQANPTCGCTISDYTKEPIAPGQSGTIKATYNAKNIGMFEKHLTVKFAGVEGMKSITIKGEVIADPNAAAPSATPAVAPAAEPVKEVAAEKTAAPVATPAKKAPAKKTAAPAKAATPAPKKP